MDKEELYKYRREIEYVGGFPGADIERNLIRIAIAKQDLELLKTLAKSYVYDESISSWVPLTKTVAEGGLMNISKFGGIAVTGRDITGDIQKLQNIDITLTQLRDALRGADTKDFSTLESDIESILNQLDITLTQLRDALRGADTKDFSTLESDIESILNQLDITLTQLRDALRGADTKDFSTLESQFAPDSSGLPAILKNFHYKAVPITIESETWYIASNEELACLKMTNNGRIWNEGKVFSIEGIYEGNGIYDGGGIYQ